MPLICGMQDGVQSVLLVDGWMQAEAQSVRLVALFYCASSAVYQIVRNTPPPISGNQVWRHSQYGMSHSLTIRPQHLTEHSYFSVGGAFPRYFKVPTIFVVIVFCLSPTSVCAFACWCFVYMLSWLDFLFLFIGRLKLGFGVVCLGRVIVDASCLSWKPPAIRCGAQITCRSCCKRCTGGWGSPPVVSSSWCCVISPRD